MRHKTTWLASLGAALEYYDFMVYGLLASYLARVFFPQNNGVVSLLQVFSVFALGYFMRPLGGVVFGHLGDRYGRRAVFLSSLMLMAVATLLIGILPTYQQAGVFAAILLVCLRAMQGIAFGAELPGAITFLVEHVLVHERGFHSSILLASISAGALLATGLLSGLTHVLSDAQMLQWGWRIPFLIGGVLAIAMYGIRMRLKETPLFLQQTARLRWPILQLIKQFPLRLLMGIGAGVMGTGLVIFQISLPMFLRRFYEFNSSDIYFATALSFLWAIIILPWLGRLVDRVGRLRLLGSFAVGLALSCFVIFKLLNHNTMIALILFILIIQFFASAMVCVYLPLLAELFPVSMRLSGVAFCYNTVYVITSLLPMLLNQWAEVLGRSNVYGLFFLLSSVTAVSVLLLLKVES